ncbi:MAG: DUF4783 domain-containing protein [Bacteroidota bacterium]
MSVTSPSRSPMRVPSVWCALAAVLVGLVSTLGLGHTAAASGTLSDLRVQHSGTDTLLVPHFEAAFGDGNAEALLESAAPRLELSIFGRASFYSRTQALFVMRDFFRRYPPESVSFRDQSIGENTRTLLGQYKELGGGRCRVAVRLRWRADAWEVRAVRLDRTADTVAGAK